MHIAGLRELYRSRNYEEIHDHIQQEVRRLELRDRSFTKDLDGLKSFVEEEIRKSMCELKGISKPLLNITLLLGEEFELKMMGMVISYLTARHSAEYQDILNCKFQRLSSLGECFAWMEDTLAKIGLKYLNIPADWNLSSEMLTRFYVLTKQRMCDYFFYCEIVESDFVEALDITVKYEKKLAKILRRGNCCIPEKSEVSLVPDCVTDDASASMISPEHCEHTRMLSSLFLPNIKTYLKAFFDHYLKSELKQDDVEMNVISGFLNFFRSLGKILRKVEYFDDKQGYKYLVQHFDSYLSVLVRNIRLETELYESAVVLNTLLFVRETANDFLEQIHEKICIEADIPKTYTEIRRIEKFHNISIDQYVSRYFEGVDFSDLTRLSMEVIKFLDEKVMTERNRGLSGDVRSSLLECVASHVFSRIYTLKITPEISELLLIEISEVKKYLGTKVSVIPMMDVIEKYLKIFLCPTEDQRCFIDNFDLVSEGIFSFEQIIRNAGCEERMSELFAAYRGRLEGTHPFNA